MGRLAEVDVSTQAGYERYVGAIRRNPHAEYIDIPSREDLAQKRAFLGENDAVGVTVAPNGEIGNLFRNPDAPSGAGAAAVQHALENGGTWLECYDGGLRRLYASLGFAEVSRLRFDPELAHGDFKDAPDVVFMAHGVQPRAGHYVDTWDEAEAAAVGKGKAMDATADDRAVRRLVELKAVGVPQADRLADELRELIGADRATDLEAKIGDAEMLLKEVAWREELHPRDFHGRFSRGHGGKKPARAPSSGSKAAEIIRSLGGKHGEAAREALGKGTALDTQHANQTGDGKYTAQREALHRDVIASLFKAAHPSQHPTAVFTAGGAASGKSGLAGQSSNDAFNLPVPSGHVYINPDEIKALLPEYNGLIASGRDDIAAAATHEESSDLAKLATAIALEGNYSVVIDGTGNSHVGKFGRKVKAARDLGYDVEVRYAHITVDEALAREKIRAQKTGRKVGEATLRGQHRSVVQSFQDDVRHIKGITIRVYSTATRGKPALIAEQNPDGKMRVVHAERYAEHVAKANA